MIRNSNTLAVQSTAAKMEALEAVQEAEAYWRHHEIVGVVCQGRLGLGNYSAKSWWKASARSRKGLVVQRIREAAEEDHHVKVVGLTS